MMRDQNFIQLKFPNLPEYCDVIRLATSGIARKAKFSEEVVEDIKMAVAEASLNVIRHAYGNKRGEVVLSFSLKPKELEILVEDKGKGFDVDLALDKSVKMNPKTPRESGFGLLIMRSIMDIVEITSDIDKGSRIRMVKKIS